MHYASVVLFKYIKVLFVFQVENQKIKNNKIFHVKTCKCVPVEAKFY